MSKVIIEFHPDDDYSVKRAFRMVAALLQEDFVLVQLRRGVKKMAYDVTALQAAIAEGRVEEAQGVELLNQFYNWELAVAKLLTPKTEPEAPATDPTPEEPTQPEVPVSDTPPEQPAEPAEAQSEVAPEPPVEG